ncbi:response regulator [Parabacteroides sp. 52]|uniref:hybrid sensor histidine kinase/response regulator transcription factor n=1 Tax=unclassified Parabacteroides TaxID=2649774 RepID=UPI0013D5B349|nr:MULTISPECIES: two-component regulator propeller domain-containing protein [unclassified Parabacteroides]NDV55105.1 response regulator [Parabacteroides sp. 52]
MRKPQLIILLFLICWGKIFAGSFRHLNRENGLSSRQVFQVTQDASGYVWLFTHMGVDRYDGSEFRHYKLDPTWEAKDHILSSTSMNCDRQGNVWISIKNGYVYTYDKKTDTFVLKINLSDYFPEPPALNDLLFDTEDRCWLCLSTGLYRFDLNTSQLLPVEAFSNENITKIIQTQNQEFFIGTHSHLYTFKNAPDSALSPQRVTLPKEVRIETLFMAFGKLYVGTFSDSAFAIDLHTGQITSFADCIPAVPIRAFASAGKNDIFVGTDGSGLYRIAADTDTLLTRYISQKDEEGSLSGNTISDMFVDERNCVWISTSTNAISILDPEQPDIQWIKHEYGNSNSLESNHVNTLLQDSDRDIWYGTNNGVSLYRNKQKKWTHFLDDKGGNTDHSSVVLTLCEDKEKNIWVGGYGIGVFRIQKANGTIEKIKKRNNPSEQGISTDYVYSIYAEGENIWFGGIEEDLTRYNIRTKTYTYYPINCIGDIKPGNDNLLLLAGCGGLAFFNKTNGETLWLKKFNETTLHYPIRCLIQASSGHIWMATDGEGLICFNPTTKESEIYTTENGLGSNAINSLLEDNGGNIWFTTEKDLYRLHAQTQTITNMNEISGTGWGHFNPNACLKFTNGDITFGTAEGAVRFAPDFNMEQEDRIQVILTDFKLLYESIQAGTEGAPLEKAINETSAVSLSYIQNSFSISFSSINFVRPHQIAYTYRLENYDTDWRQAGSMHTVDYMNLKPGKYLFQLKAVNKYTQKVLGERFLEIHIGKPFWASGLAYLLYVVLIVWVILLFIQYGRNKIAKHNAKEKIRFFIDIAHDIRTPVTLIKAPLSELETQENLSEEGKKSLSIATKNADKLFLMVTQLLDLQKADLDAEKMILAPQDLNRYMQEKVTAFRMAAIQKNIDLLLRIDPLFPEVWFDKGKMDKIMDNMLSNAIKYTEEGFISIIAKHTQNKWTIEIQDTGIGIPANEQKNLFKQFYRAENAINSNESGSGIGLILTQKLMQLHEGSLTFSSTENKGSSFILTFPLKRKLARPIEKTPEATDLSPDAYTSFTPTGKEVLLLAEDNDDMREYLTDSLSKEYQVVSVTDGKKALELAKEINPDIIISDILMPVLRGDEICRILKSSIETSHIPFILLSALSEKENVIMGLEAGANDYIIKPFDFSVLKVRIRNILQNREQLRKTVLSPDAEMEDTDYATLLDKEFLDKAIRIINAELNNPDFSINDFCRMLGMSRTSVYNKIKSLTDQGPNDFIRIIRLNKAKELLRSKKYTISEVAYMVGFSDPKYFSTSFKKQFGTSPSKAE